MNRHEFVDVATISLSSLLTRNSRLFSRSVSSAPIGDVVAGAAVDIEELQTRGVQEISARTPIGEFQAAYLVSQWRGPDVPTLLYLHGSGEDPFDVGRFSANSFHRLFGTDLDWDLNLIALRAPFHDRSSREYHLSEAGGCVRTKGSGGVTPSPQLRGCLHRHRCRRL